MAPFLCQRVGRDEQMDVHTLSHTLTHTHSHATYHEVGIADVVLDDATTEDDHSSLLCVHSLGVDVANVWLDRGMNLRTAATIVRGMAVRACVP